MIGSFSTLVIFLLAGSFCLGVLVGLIWNRPRRVISVPPNIERERAIAEAKESQLIGLVEKHLVETELKLSELANQQSKMLANFDTQIRTPPDINKDETLKNIIPPKDYPDTHGQLGKT